jgi:hypothetical protein
MLLRMVGIFARIATNKKTGTRMSTNINGKISLVLTYPLEKLFNLFRKKKDTREEYTGKCTGDNTHACNCPGDGSCQGHKLP